jgi:hypothetical protein
MVNRSSTKAPENAPVMPELQFYGAVLPCEYVGQRPVSMEVASCHA